MTRLQLLFIFVTFFGPLLAWSALRIRRDRRTPEISAGLEQAVSWALAAVLVFSFAGSLYLKAQKWGLGWDDSLPMQLCDWAAVAVLAALLGHRQAAFDLAYVWGFAGTLQGLLTPAVAINGGPLVWLFLIAHSVIPASVLWLILEAGLRPSPACLRRVMIWSEIYFVSALIANALTGGNYGFLAHRPDKPSLLDIFPDNWWLYVLSINLFGLFIFVVMVLPWRLVRPPS